MGTVKCSIHIKGQVKVCTKILGLSFFFFPIHVAANTVFHLDSYSLAYTRDVGPPSVLCYKKWTQKNSLAKVIQRNWWQSLNSVITNSFHSNLLLMMKARNLSSTLALPIIIKNCL